MAKNQYKPTDVPPKWREILCRLPKYDPFKDVPDGCYFDVTEAKRAIDFFPACLKFVESTKHVVAGTKFTLRGWQESIVANLFGCKRPDGTRRYQRVLLYVARKNGKTPLLAGILLYLLLCDHEGGAQIYSAAAARDQAAIVFRHAAGFVANDESLLSRCKVYRTSKTIEVKGTSSYFHVLAADADTKHGKQAHAVGIDELHAHPNRDLVDVLETSVSGRAQPVILYCTTADYDRPSICNELYDYSKSIIDGTISDPYFLPCIYECSPEDDWTDPKVWAKANPNLGVSKTMDYMEAECRKAQRLPSVRARFMRLDLNIRTSQSTIWLPMEAYDASDDAIDVESLKGRQCWGGLDLASTTDTASLVLCFPQGDELYDFLSWFWIPSDNAKEREDHDRVPYREWVNAKYITATDGNRIDFRFIRNRVNELMKLYGIQAVGYDPYSATQISMELREEDGLDMTEFRQGMITMNEPCKTFESLLVRARLRFGLNPVMRWQAGNATIKTDMSDNIRPVKDKSFKRIDGIVAAIMALAMTRQAESKTVSGKSVYDDRGLLIF